MSWYNRFCSSALGSTHVKFDAWPEPQFYSSFRSLESTNEETIMLFLKRSNHSMTLSPSQTVHLTTTPTHHHRHSQPTYDVSPVSLKSNIKKPNWTGDGRQYHLLVPQQLILPTVLSGLLLMSTPIGRKVIPWKNQAITAINTKVLLAKGMSYNSTFAAVEEILSDVTIQTTPLQQCLDRYYLFSM